MQVYKVEYYTLAKGKNPSDDVGNVLQWNAIAYIQCGDTSRVQNMLRRHFDKPSKHGRYYFPVVKSITAVKGDCLVCQEQLESKII